MTQLEYTQLEAELLECVRTLVAEAKEHWPDAENWECIEIAEDLIAKATNG